MQDDHAIHDNRPDYVRLPPSDKQIAYARALAGRAGVALPHGVMDDRRAISDWIDRNKRKVEAQPYAAYPTGKQVRFAERIARRKRREIPRECFRDKTRMSRWIDAHI